MIEANRGAPTPPIELAGGAAQASARLAATEVPVPDAVLARLRDSCTDVSTDAVRTAEAARDWWPLAMTWALQGGVAARVGAVARPASADEVAAVLRICNEAHVPVTAAAGRSGVLGGSVPAHGGVVLDLTGLTGIVDVDRTSMVLDVLAGTFGDVLEDELRAEHGATLGHWPQSMVLSTVGGWLACRSAGQYSTRYGKIEDMVTGLDVALADGTLLHTGGAPRAAVGPDLTQLFVGSEGTLGVITSARLRIHPAPVAEQRAAYAFPSFVAGVEAMRTILQRGATPAVLRLYDPVEAQRNYQIDDRAVLLVLDEGDPVIVDAVMAVARETCASAEPLDGDLVGQWLGHRNDVAALEALISRDFVVDTMEVSGCWSALPATYEAVLAAIGGVEHTIVVSAHQSHSYTDGGCLYFTFAGRPPVDAKDGYHAAVWDAGTRAALASGCALSHHHGVGLHRARYVREALGAAYDVLAGLKQALDPHGILNPGKLGLPDPFGPVALP